MGIGFRLEQQAARPQIFDDQRISSFYEDPAPRGYFRHERSIRKHSHQYRQVMFLGHLHIFLTKRRRHVDKPGAIFSGDKITKHHVMRRFIWRHEGEQRMVFQAF